MTTINAKETATLTETEKRELQNAESSIRNGLRSFWNVGKAIGRIQDRRLYRATHSTAAKYFTEKWDMSTARVSQLVHAARVYELIRDAGIMPLPQTESQCRPLVRLVADEHLDDNIKKAWLAAGAGQKLTAKTVASAVDVILGKQPQQGANPDPEGNKDDARKAGKSDDTSNETSASAEMRAELRALKQKIAFLESALAAEKSAHARTQKSGGIPQSAMAKKLFKAGFRTLAQAMHPDHGGSATAVAELNNLKTTLGI
jgi:hypothetical protein